MADKYFYLKQFIEKDARIIDVLLSSGEVVICRSKSTGKTKQMIFRNLYMNNRVFWKEAAATWDYFVTREGALKVKNQLKAKDAEKDVAASVIAAGDDFIPEKKKASVSPGAGAELDNFGEDYEKIDKLTMDEKVNLLNIRKEWLLKLSANMEVFNEEKLEAVVESSKDAALVNKSVIDAAMGMDDAEAKEFTSQVEANTQELIRAVKQLMSADIIKYEMFKGLVEKSNGTVIQHMTRVFLTGFAFLHYYNDQARVLGIAQKLRIRFAKDYKKYYKTLCPHLHDDYVTLEHVFMGGIKALSEAEMHDYALGYLMHDIGKVDDIEYHEGEDAYDREKVVRHVKRGYQAIVNKTNYGRAVALITGYHHEYYNNRDGYGYFREFLEQYRKSNPKASLDFCMAYDMESVVDYKALAYFPAKVIEIVDIYDSITDKNRKYRKPLSMEAALEFMRSAFIENDLKIDPVLFDMWCAYMRQKPLMK